MSSDFKEAFYFVFGEGGNEPKHRHAKQNDAIVEARRLAEKHPGKKFHVCRAICTVEMPTGIVIVNYGRLRDHDPDSRETFQVRQMAGMLKTYKPTQD